jgi:hypothetical protein
MEVTVESLQQEVVTLQSAGDRAGEARAMTRLAAAHLALCDSRHAIECFQQALVIFQEVGDRSGESGAALGLRNAYTLQGHLARAAMYPDQDMRALVG